jgi:hypothetical protein
MRNYTIAPSQTEPWQRYPCAFLDDTLASESLVSVAQAGG